MRQPKPWRSLTVTTLLLMVVAVGLRGIPGLDEVSDLAVVSVLFFALLTFVSVRLVQRGLKTGRPVRFVSAVMLNFIIRLLASAALVVIILLTVRPDPAALLIPFSICYLAFTVMETIWLMKLNRVPPINRGQPSTEGG